MIYIQLQIFILKYFPSFQMNPSYMDNRRLLRLLQKDSLKCLSAQDTISSMDNW